MFFYRCDATIVGIEVALGMKSVSSILKASAFQGLCESKSEIPVVEGFRRADQQRPGALECLFLVCDHFSAEFVSVPEMKFYTTDVSLRKAAFPFTLKSTYLWSICNSLQLLNKF